MLLKSLLLADKRKPDSTLVFKIYTKKQENFNQFVNKILKENEDRKPVKNAGLQRLEFMPRNLD